MANKKLKLTSEQYDRIFVKNIINESIQYKDLHNAVLGLIRSIYGQDSSNSDDFWVSNNTTREEIEKFLCGVGLLTQKNDDYIIPKKYKENIFDKPEKAIDFIEKSVAQYLKNNTLKAKKALETEATGNNHDIFHVIAMNREIAILKDNTNALFVFYYYDLEEKELAQYADREKRYVGRADGEPDFEYDDNFDITSDTIEAYVNDNIRNISKGEGLEAFENNANLVKIDEPLKNELMQLYDKDSTIMKVLSSIEESKSSEDAISSFKDDVKNNFTPKNDVKKTPEQIKIALAKLKDKEQERRKQNGETITPDQIKKTTPTSKSKEIEETTTSASSGAFVGPIGTGDDDIIRKNTPTVDEVTVAGSAATGGSSGPYDANALPNIGRDGSFKKTKIKQKSQYKGGKFVKLDDCTKLNNNKEAQNGKCNQGSVVKLKDSIYEQISKKTGKTIEEIRKIVEKKPVSDEKKRLGKEYIKADKALKAFAEKNGVSDGYLSDEVRSTDEFKRLKLNFDIAYKNIRDFISKNKTNEV